MNKQYLLVVDDVGMALMQQMIPRLQFVPVEGMITGSETHFVLATPKPATTDTPQPEPIVVDDLLEMQDRRRDEHPTPLNDGAIDPPMEMPVPNLVDPTSTEAGLSDMSGPMVFPCDVDPCDGMP